MFKRFTARIIIALQVYNILFQGVLCASTYDELSGNYKVAILSSSTTEFVPSFRLTAIDVATAQETALENIALADLSSKAPVVLSHLLKASQPFLR